MTTTSRTIADLFQETLRHLLCMGQEDFMRVWGPNLGAHYWMKWTSNYDRHSIKFLTAMDLHPLQLLIDDAQISPAEAAIRVTPLG